MRSFALSDLARPHPVPVFQQRSRSFALPRRGASLDDGQVVPRLDRETNRCLRKDGLHRPTRRECDRELFSRFAITHCLACALPLTRIVVRFRSQQIEYDLPLVVELLQKPLACASVLGTIFLAIIVAKRVSFGIDGSKLK